MVAPTRVSRLPIHTQRRTTLPISIRTALGCFGLSLVSFYGGILLGSTSCNCNCAPPPPPAAQVKTPTSMSAIPDRMKKLVAGMARVDRDEFMEKFDIGVPKDKTVAGNEDVLLLYSADRALPDADSKKGHGDGNLPLLSTDAATKHCTTLKLILTEPSRKECLAIVGQWESYHIQKYMRLPPNKDRKVESNEKYPLRPVSRLFGDKGLQQQIPIPLVVQEYDKTLVTYLSSLDTVLSELKPIAQKAAKDNTVIVMLSNHGQSELLMNFACSSRARGFDLSQVLVFATDLETKALADGLGLAVFYDHTNFAAMPEAAALEYADKSFKAMMMAKVYCVHMINKLGYNLLFQDVDIVWYQNPMQYFTNASSPHHDFDMYFQDDGSHQRRYAPYSPNSGFYFVRHNERTEYFFHSVLMSGDIIAQTGSHQNAMAAVLNEHTSVRGLRVKTLDREMDEFPGGFHYNMPSRKQYMKDFIAGTIKPYIFHMSWTKNKDNKQRYFEQMGDWYVKDECVGSTVTKILHSTQDDLGTACCSAQPIFRCHYRDKPSKIPCKNSPPIDRGKPSWW